MKFETSTKTADFGKKPHIKKGFYPAKLKEVKPLEKEGMYGKRIVLIWDIFQQNKTDPVTYQEGNVTKDVSLAQVLYSEYKTEDGSYRTAFTPNSSLTKTFKALGWEGPESGKEIETDNYVGKFAEALVQDYEVKEATGSYTASSIKEISELKEESSGEDSPSSPSLSPILTPELFKKIEQLEKLYKEGNLTKDGFEKAVEQLEQQARK